MLDGYWGRIGGISGLRSQAHQLDLESIHVTFFIGRNLDLIEAFCRVSSPARAKELKTVQTVLVHRVVA